MTKVSLFSAISNFGHLYIYSKIQSDGVTGIFILSYDFGFNFKLFKDYPGPDSLSDSIIQTQRLWIR